MSFHVYYFTWKSQVVAQANQGHFSVMIKIRPMIFERGVFSFICLNHLQDLTAIATPAIELSFPEQTNYPPKQCLCVSNRTGTNTSLLFPCLCMICVEDDSAEQGMAFICWNLSTHQATGRSWKHLPPCRSFCLPVALPFSNLGEMTAQVWCLVPVEASGKAFEPCGVIRTGWAVTGGHRIKKKWEGVGQSGAIPKGTGSCLL